MSLSSTYASLKSKVTDKPWYTRWVWWALAACVGVIVLALWSMAKKQEARSKAALEVAETRATQAKLMALSEKDREKAAKLAAESVVAEQQAKAIRAQMDKSAAARRELEAAIKGATSWEELEKLEKEIG